jgi:hypothetical protein
MRKLARNGAFLLLVGAAAFARTAPVQANYGCEPMQPNCCAFLEFAIEQSCGGMWSYWMGNCCENCGWDDDQCCAEFTCVG